MRDAIADRRLQAGALALSIILIAGVLAIGPLSTHGQVPSPSPSSPVPTPVPSVTVDSSLALGAPSATDQASTSSIPTPSPSEFHFPIETPGQPTPTLRATPSPTPFFTTTGWPIEFNGDQSGDGDSATIGPDGTLFIDGAPGFDAKGRARTGWQLPDGSYAQPAIFASDGTSYALVSPPDEDSSNDQPDELYAFDKNADVRAGWPIDVESDADIQPGPAASVYVFEGLTDDTVKVSVYTPDAKKKASWSFANPGSDCGEVVRPDGSVYFAYGPSDSALDCAIRVFGPTGTLQSPAPTRGWNGIALMPDGGVVTWGYDMEPYGSAVARTRVAKIGPDGQAMAGWPVTVEGAASEPAFGPDGTMYLTELGLGTTPSQIVAFDTTGAPKSGWPVALPAGFGPLLDDSEHPNPPELGNAGVVYCAAVDKDLMGYVMAFDSSGAAVPGWPYKLPQAFSDFSSGATQSSGPTNPGPIFASGPAGSTATGGLVYLMLDDRVVALKPDGTVAPGWPRVLSGAYADAIWEAALVTPDGGLIAVASASRQDDSDNEVDFDVAFRWTVSGGQP